MKCSEAVTSFNNMSMPAISSPDMIFLTCMTCYWLPHGILALKRNIFRIIFIKSIIFCMLMSVHWNRLRGAYKGNTRNSWHMLRKPLIEMGQNRSEKHTFIHVLGFVKKKCPGNNCHKSTELCRNLSRILSSPILHQDEQQRIPKFITTETIDTAKPTINPV